MKTFVSKYGLWICLAVVVTLAAFLYPTLYPSRRPDRPIAGDHLQPRIMVAQAWKAGGIGRLEMRLRVWGQAAEDHLNDVEVPNEVLPEATVRFYRGEEELAPSGPCKVERMC